MRALILALVLLPCVAFADTISVRSPLLDRDIYVQVDLDVPEAPAPVPAVVLAHGCGGISKAGSQAPQNWRTVFRAQGYATMIVDSFRPREWKDACTNPAQSNAQAQADRANELRAAADYLARRPDIDPQRITLMGFSHGAGAALYTAMRDPGRFTHIIANYPWCGATPQHEFRASTKPIRTPLLVMVGTADDYTPAEFCKAMVQQHPGSTDLRLVLIDGAAHSYDSSTPLRTLTGCGGTQAKCGIQVTAGHNDEAFTQAQAAVSRFLGK